MMFFRVLVVSCVMLAVPTTALAGALTRAHCQAAGASAGAQTDMSHAGHAMHSGMAMGHEAMPEHPGHGHSDQTDKTDKTMKGSCKCGCSCSGQHCTPGGAGFLSAEIGDGMSLDAAVIEAASALVAHVSAAHDLALLRPPTLF